MDSLVAYESDSSEDSSEGPLVSTDTTWHPDFFNLDSIDDEDCAKNHPSSYQDKHDLAASDSESSKIAESDFWSNMSSSDMKDSGVHAEKVSHTVVLEKRTSDRPRKHQYFSSITKSEHCTHSNAKVTKMEVNHGLSQNQNVTDTSSIPENSTYSNRNSVDSVQSNTRKMFYAHSKVTPFLYANKLRTCKVPRSKEKEVPIAHGGAVNRMQWNIPQSSHLLLTVSMDSTVKIWNPWSQVDCLLKTLTHHNKAVKDAVWSPCGRFIVSGSFDRTAAISDVEKGIATTTFPHSSFVSSCKIHPVNANIVITGSNNCIQCWDKRSPENPFRQYTHKDNFGQVQDVLLTQDGQNIFSCCDLISRDSSDRNIMAWDFRTTAILSNQIYHERYSCVRLKLHPFDELFLAQSQGGYIALFSTERPFKMMKSKRFGGHKVDGYSIGFDISNDGRHILSGSSDGMLYCYDYRTGKLFQKLRTGLDIIMDVCHHPVLPSVVAVCGWNGSLQVWQ